MPIVAITREMGSLGKDVAEGLGEALDLPVVYHEVIEPLADRMRVRKSHVKRLLDGSAGLFERLTADKTSMSIFSADEILNSALQGRGAVIRGWGATYLLREVRRSSRTTKPIRRSCGAISRCSGPSRRTTIWCSTPSA